MSRFIFAALGSISFAGAVAAQQVPGRDLLEFPVGLLAEAAPLSTQMTGGLWNPATAALPSTERAALAIAGVTSPQALGVGLDLVAAALRFHQNLTASVSIASGSVSDILATNTDPQSLGPELQYGTTLLSAGLATTRKHFTYGLAARYRRGTIDREHAGTFALDAGAMVDRVAGTPIRVAASTFLFTPSRRDREATYSVAADAPVYRRDSLVVRAGYSVAHTESRGRDEYAFATARIGMVDLSTGLSRAFAFGNTSNRWRLGCGLVYASYTLAAGREEGAAGVGASYQFLLKRVFR